MKLFPGRGQGGARRNWVNSGAPYCRHFTDALAANMTQKNKSRVCAGKLLGKETATDSRYVLKIQFTPSSVSYPRFCIDHPLCSRFCISFVCRVSLLARTGNCAWAMISFRNRWVNETRTSQASTGISIDHIFFLFWGINLFIYLKLLRVVSLYRSFIGCVFRILFVFDYFHWHRPSPWRY